MGLLNDPSVRLITVTGPGGVGKTRLAVKAGEQYGAAQDTPVCFVDMSAIEDPAGVAPALATALGIPQNPDEEALRTLVRVLGSQRVLLICDNVERVLGGVETLLDILRRCPCCPNLVEWCIDCCFYRDLHARPSLKLLRQLVAVPDVIASG